MNKEKSDFTQGSILKKLIPFMIPILGALVLQAAYGAVDLLVVGRFGSTAGLSAVSTGSQILNLVTFVITQLAMGITVLIARYIGEKSTGQIGQLLGGAVTVFAIVSAVLFVVMVFFAKPLAVLMQAPQEAISLTTVYVRICGGGIFFIVAYNVLAAIFRGLGDSRSPLIFVAVACVVNIISFFSGRRISSRCGRSGNCNRCSTGSERGSCDCTVKKERFKIWHSKEGFPNQRAV